MAVIADIDAILGTLTLEEKVRLVAGGDFSSTAAIPEKNVPFIKVADGPNGVRAAATDRSIRSACFPAACSVASTFDVDIARRVGHALAEEARHKGAQCILGPAVCIQRHPLGGRNFETFSEDPFLAGKLSSQVIQGLQSLGVSATIKHFVANEQETDRTNVDETISERALREIYLRPFEIAIKEAKPWAVMTAYNLINGTHCDANKWLIQNVLRGSWGWEGLLMSDWGGTNSVADALNIGLDLEMPGPPRIRKPDRVCNAIEQGETSETAIDDRVRNVLSWVFQLKALQESIGMPDAVVLGDNPQHRALIRDAGAKGMVLLKNDQNLLPLTTDKVRGRKIALIGFAQDALAHGGGSAAVNSYYKITPWEGLSAALKDTHFTFAKGAHRERLLPPIHKDGNVVNVIGLDGKPGFTRTFLEEHSDSSTKKTTSVDHGQETSAYSPLGSNQSFQRVLEIVGDITFSETGSHYWACSGLGPTTVSIDDEVVYSQEANCTDPMGALFLAAPEQGSSTNIWLEKRRSGVRLGLSLESEHDADLEGQAVQAAKDADIAIVFTGHDQSWETEGRDQESFHLPRQGSQDSLVSAVAAANKNTIVVNSTGTPVAMPWLDQVKCVIQAWFPGQECGNAIADVLTGAINPEGHLPVTFPRRLEDSPAYGNFPGQYVDGKLQVEYAEGIFVGYRHYDRVSEDKVLFPFGHGLSYTTFSYGPMDIFLSKEQEDTLEITVRVANTGTVLGGALVQIYAGQSSRSGDHPVKQLIAFKKLRLDPLETTETKLRVSLRDLAYFDDSKQGWVLDEAEHTFYLCESASKVLQSNQVSMQRRFYGV